MLKMRDLDPKGRSKQILVDRLRADTTAVASVAAGSVDGTAAPAGAENGTPLEAESAESATDSSTESDTEPQTEPAAQTQERVSTDAPSATANDVSEGETMKPSTTLRACSCTGDCVGKGVCHGDSRCPDYKGFGVRPPRCPDDSYDAALARIKGLSHLS